MFPHTKLNLIQVAAGKMARFECQRKELAPAQATPDRHRQHRIIA
jgi:hypothetical protein